jgi:hypothetical protein
MNGVRRTFLVLTLLLPAMAVVSSPSLGMSHSTKMDATIFSYDGEDFVRSKTTLTAEAKSVANTKLDRDSAAYKALAEKRSYSGATTLFGQDYEGHYAPLTDADGKLTGALFVGVPK